MRTLREIIFDLFGAARAAADSSNPAPDKHLGKLDAFAQWLYLSINGTIEEVTPEAVRDMATKIADICERLPDSSDVRLVDLKRFARELSVAVTVDRSLRAQLAKITIKRPKIGNRRDNDDLD